MESDVSQALLNGRRVAELEGSASRRLTLVQANTARLETPTLRVFVNGRDTLCRSVVLVLAAIVLIAPQLAAAQEAKPGHQKTSAPADVRFEFLQSEVAAKITLRLDKYSGTVSQMIQSKDGDRYFWQELPRRAHSLDRRVDGRVNYQLFTSGLAARFTYLMNVNTGATWQLIETQERDLVWAPIQ